MTIILADETSLPVAGVLGGGVSRTVDVGAAGGCVGGLGVGRVVASGRRGGRGRASGQAPGGGVSPHEGRPGAGERAAHPQYVCSPDLF